MTRHLRPESLTSVPFIEQMAFQTAMREVTCAVSIVTAGEGEDRRGLTVTSLCSLSLDPPSLVVCVNKATEGHRMMLRYGSFCVNIAAAEHKAIAECFAGRTERRGIDRFAEGDWTTLVTGAPALANAVAILDCDVLDRFERATHSIFVGGVRAVHSDPNRSALAYRSGHFHQI